MAVAKTKKFSEAPHRLVERVGRIVVKPPAWTVATHIWEIGNGGAKIELPFEFSLSEEFPFIFEAERTLVDVRLVSQNGRIARIAFLNAPRSVALHRYRPLHELRNGEVEAAVE